ncbi:methylmalonyl-CoA epimerase [Rhodohalobacter sp. SW132]|uniref:methylmalonyl-CoA epimerase n=1 Tax=Rhodohalobacter sp. SW132 TaxID=2293433 RepID=UPI000E258404|nr:methylmalonyl-CoA epimerase [Rhodohalobacter sp. SW132]REL24578.1 methylmalonyl-CoA epimerase [Rhodohalobacter sp. SW132]
MHIDHIGIAVKDLQQAIDTYKKILNRPCLKTETVESEKVETAFFQTGESKVELLGPTDSSSVIQKFIDKKGEGIHHVAFEVEDIKQEIKRLAGEGFTILNEQPKPGADNKLVAFLHPKDNHGVLVELCQTRSANEG